MFCLKKWVFEKYKKVFDKVVGIGPSLAHSPGLTQKNKVLDKRSFDRKNFFDRNLFFLVDHVGGVPDWSTFH